MMTAKKYNRRFQIDQKKANSAQISLLREICAIFAVFFLFIIIKIKKISPETRIIRPTSKRSPCNLKPSNITTLNSTLAPLWVQGEEALCCIATALRGLGHQPRRKVVRSDKFVEPFDNVMKSWVTWVLRSFRHDDPP